MFKNPYHIIAKMLVAYVGLIQIAHFYVLARAAFIFQQTGELTFPALPPPGGWAAQTVPLLMATGVVDAVNVGLILLFVLAYFVGHWWWRPLGILTLSIFFYSSIMYISGTVPSGAWQRHPLEYWSVAAVFVPVFLLMFLFFVWSTRRAFWVKDNNGRS